MHLHLSVTPHLQAGNGTARELALLDAALLAWLALEGPTSRARLAQLLWPDKDAQAARNSLRQRLFQLRRQIGVELVVGSTTLTLAEGVTHDLHEADGVLGDTPADAIATGEFAHWLEQQRTRQRERMRRSLVELAEMAEAAKDFDDALTRARELLALEPLSEEAHRRVMRLHYLAGDRAAALLAFDRCEKLLKDEVGASPSAPTLALLKTIETVGEPRVAERHASVPASVVRPPRMVGRDRELAALAAALPARNVAAVVGEAGMGKSRLLQTLAQRQAGIVGCAARPGDAGVPFASLARLLRTLAGVSAAQAEDPVAQRALAQVLPEWRRTEPAPPGELQRLVLARGVGALLAARPAIEAVYVDDLHFADSASLEVLRLLIDDEGGAADVRLRRCWLLAYRAAEAGSVLAALHAGMVEQARWVSVALAPLSETALAELVDSLGLPEVQGRELAPGLLRRTGGNPLFVLETIKQAWVERTLDQLSAPLPRPPSVMRLIEHRLGQLSAGALALARCAAVAGQCFTPALAARVLAVHPLALADAWAELERAQIVRDQQIAHDLYHEAVLASVPAAIARHLHAEVAAQLEGEAAPAAAPATLAEHWLAAHRPERAIPHLEAAARAAREALDPVLVARFLGELAQARSATGAHDAAFASANEAVTALAGLDTGAALEAAIGRLAALARTPEHRAVVQEARGAMLHFRGDAAAAAAAAAQGLAELGPDGAPAQRIKLLNLQGNVLRRASRLPEARASLEQALALLRATPGTSPAGDLAPVLNNLALVLQEMDEHLAACGLLQEAAGVQTDPLLRARVINNLGISLEERGQVALAYEQRLAAARLCAAAQSEGVADLNLAISLGANARNLARFRDALAHLARAERIAANVAHHREEDLHRQYTAVWLELGRVNLAQQSLQRALQAADPPEESFALCVARARVMIASGEDARELLERTEHRVREAREWRTLRRLLVCKAQVLPPQQAAGMMDELLQTPALYDNAGAAIPCHVRMAQALLALGEPARAERHAQRAADVLDVALPLEMSCAEVWLTLARVLEARGEPAAAAQAAGRGRRWVEQVAAEHIDEPCRDGFLRRNRVNVDLLVLAARLTPR